MPAIKTVDDLLAMELKAIHSAERQLSRAVPRLAKAVASEQLRSMLEERRDQGARLMEEVDQCLENLETTKGRPKNAAAEGLIDDLEMHLENTRSPEVADALILAGVQKLEHYCIAAWGTVRAMGEMTGQQELVRSMERALDEGKRMDEALTRLAEDEVNPAMMQDAEQDADA